MSNSRKKQEHRAVVTVAAIGAVATVVAAIVGIAPDVLQRSDDTPTNNLTVTATPQTSTPMPDPRLMFQDTFDDNEKGWLIDSSVSDFNTSGYRVYKHIENGKYVREMETNEKFVRTSGAVGIPSIAEKNFCLIFDSRIRDSLQDIAIVIVARAIGWDSYYQIELSTNGKGSIRVNNTRQIGEWENGVSWIDGKAHPVKISFQDKRFEIFDGQDNRSIFNLDLTGSGLLANSGDIRIGLKPFYPNQKAIVEFDNVFVYDRCP